MYRIEVGDILEVFGLENVNANTASAPGENLCMSQPEFFIGGFLFRDPCFVEYPTAAERRAPR